HNSAYATVRIGILLAQGIALLPLLSIQTGAVWTDIRPLLGWGAGASIVLVALNWVFDLAIRRSGGLDGLLTESAPDSLVKAGLYIASGLVINAALSGTAPDLLTSVFSTLVFGILGFVAVVLGYVLLGFVGPFKGRRRIGEHNMAASILSAGVIIALGLMLRLAVSGDFAGWADGLLGFALTAVLGYVLLVLLIFVVDLFVVRSRTLGQIVAQNEVVAAAVMATMLIAVGLAFSAVTI
ncbi:MAG: DUF350 domain-containing protein, partial [Allobranchiibius sp.]